MRNWDYRFCWLRDATFALYALNIGGYVDEAIAWRDWLLRAAAGHPSQMQILYGAAGEQRLTETELPWLTGYEGSRPVRIGNAAYDQFQLDGGRMRQETRGLVQSQSAPFPDHLDVEVGRELAELGDVTGDNAGPDRRGV